MDRHHVGRLLAAVGASVLVLAVSGMVSADVFNMPAGQTNLTMVPVGDSGNAADTLVMSDGTHGYGSVSYAYSIGQYDVTAGQYTAFLNAVAKTDTYVLYDPLLANSFASCGISRSGSAGNYSYLATKNANFPVNWVSWASAARFCNWLQNGQPTGPEGNGTTETGSYNLNGATTDSVLMSVTRNAGAKWFIPSENEWYKAAYYKGGAANAGYWLYPTQSNSIPSNVLSVTGINNANYYTTVYTDPTNYLTAVGTFAASPSAYDTFDQGGDLWEWNDTVIGSARGLRGGSFHYASDAMQSAYRSHPTYGPTYDSSYYGFRVSEIPDGYQVPEPASLGLLVFGTCALLARRRFA